MPLHLPKIYVPFTISKTLFFLAFKEQSLRGRGLRTPSAAIGFSLPRTWDTSMQTLAANFQRHLRHSLVVVVSSSLSHVVGVEVFCRPRLLVQLQRLSFPKQSWSFLGRFCRLQDLGALLVVTSFFRRWWGFSCLAFAAALSLQGSIALRVRVCLHGEKLDFRVSCLSVLQACWSSSVQLGSWSCIFLELGRAPGCKSRRFSNALLLPSVAVGSSFERTGKSLLLGLQCLTFPFKIRVWISSVLVTQFFLSTVLFFLLRLSEEFVGAHWFDSNQCILNRRGLGCLSLPKTSSAWL